MFENTALRVILGDFKQYGDFINYVNHGKVDLQYFYVF